MLTRKHPLGWTIFLLFTIINILACASERPSTISGGVQVQEGSGLKGDIDKVLDSTDPTYSEAIENTDLDNKPLRKDNDVSLSIRLSSDSVVRYRVQEQLAKFSLPNDAVGETKEIDGELIFDESGSVLPGSGFSLNVLSITSDESKRDRYVSRNTLKSDMFPTIEFNIKDVRDLPWPLPIDQEVEIQLLGDLTVKDVTKPVTWNVSINFLDDIAIGSANVIITFEQFSIDKPTLAFILSVEDEIRLELAFKAQIFRHISK